MSRDQDLHALFGTPTPQAQPAPAAFAPPSLRLADILNPDQRTRRLSLAEALGPAHPVQAPHDLHGRERELAQLIDAVLLQRKHAIVHGLRGAGKTSLVRVFGDQADREGRIVIYLAADATASFAELIAPYLRSIPPASIASEQREAFAQRVAALGAGARPRDIVELLSALTGPSAVFILDEFDRVTDKAVLNDVAALMKLLSDALVPVQLVVVGIARSVQDVFEAHPSLLRHTSVVALAGLGDEAVAEIIGRGLAAAGMGVEPEARALLVRTAAGSAYHARLLSHHAASRALARRENHVALADARLGLAQVLADWGQAHPERLQLFRSLAGLGPAARERLARVAAHIARSGAEPLSKAQQHPCWADTPGLETLKEALVEDSLGPQALLAALEVCRTPAAEPASVQSAPTPAPAILAGPDTNFLQRARAARAASPQPAFVRYGQTENGAESW